MTGKVLVGDMKIDKQIIQKIRVDNMKDNEGIYWRYSRMRGKIKKYDILYRGGQILWEIMEDDMRTWDIGGDDMGDMGSRHMRYEGMT